MTVNYELFILRMLSNCNKFGTISVKNRQFKSQMNQFKRILPLQIQFLRAFFFFFSFRFSLSVSLTCSHFQAWDLENHNAQGVVMHT